jgi:Ca-activated chloride channel homolog
MNRFLLALSLVFSSLLASAQDENAVQDRTDWRGLVQLARDAYQAKEYQRALLFYQTAIPAIPEDVDLSDELAQTQYRLEQYDAASSIYSKKTSGEKTKKAKAFHNLGNIAMQKQDYKTAIESYKNALRNNPKNEKTRYNLSEAIRRKKEAEKKNPPPPPKDKDQEKDEQDQEKDQKDKKDEDSKDTDGQKNPSSLSDNSVERELDRLMKKEAKTKRKVASAKEGQNKRTTNKEW